MEFFYSKSRDSEKGALCGLKDWRKRISAFGVCENGLEVDGKVFVSIEMAFHYEKFKRTDRADLGEVYIKGGIFDSDPGKGKVYSGKASMKKLGCKLDVERWNKESVGVMRNLVNLRKERDEIFRSIILSAKESGVPLLHFERGTLKKVPFWGCFRSKETGEIVGVNMYGKFLME